MTMKSRPTITSIYLNLIVSMFPEKMAGHGRLIKCSKMAWICFSGLLERTYTLQLHISQ